MDRRHFLRLTGLAAGALVTPRPGWALGAGVAEANTIFSEVPAARSGLTWVHENGMSPARRRASAAVTPS